MPTTGSRVWRTHMDNVGHALRRVHTATRGAGRLATLGGSPQKTHKELGHQKAGAWHCRRNRTVQSSQHTDKTTFMDDRWKTAENSRHTCKAPKKGVHTLRERNGRDKHNYIHIYAAHIQGETNIATVGYATIPIGKGCRPLSGQNILHRTATNHDRTGSCSCADHPGGSIAPATHST